MDESTLSEFLGTLNHLADQPDSYAVRAVLFVDVDGTLVPETSSAVFLAARLGHADQVAEAEAAWDAGRVTARHVEELDARGWAGTAEAQVSEWLAGPAMNTARGTSRKAWQSSTACR